MRIDLKKILKGKYTYTTRSGHKHPLESKPINETEILVSYKISGDISRSVSRVFPRYIDIDERFVWMSGFIDGEGLKSKNPRSSMYRFAVTNNDPNTIKRVLQILDETKIVKIDKVPYRSIRISYGEGCNLCRLKNYWSKKLSISKEKIFISNSPQKEKKAKYGTATLCISDVLLRRVMDIILEYTSNKLFPSSPVSASAF